jgi:3-deoxy-manno-octulosonate cytidylyltransferase (CMP-KDO synthetase)
MIEHVYDRCVEAQIADLVVIATPDRGLITALVKQYGFDTCELLFWFIETSADCATGSDRVAEAAKSIKDKYRYIINVQGDMPFINPDHIRLVAERRWQSEADVVTAAAKSYSTLLSGRFVWREDRVEHVGIYAFTAKGLQDFASLPQTEREISSGLELQRAFDHGMTVETVMLPYAPLEVNTPEDVQRLRDVFR